MRSFQREVVFFHSSVKATQQRQKWSETPRNSVRVRHTEIYIVGNKVEGTRAREKGAAARVRSEIYTRVHVHADGFVSKVRQDDAIRGRIRLTTYIDRRFPEVSSVVWKNVSLEESSSATATQTRS